MKPTPETILRYGEPGSPIKGSRLVRGYCRVCGTPIRRDPNAVAQECEICSGVQRDLMPGGYAGQLDEDEGGYGSIARRAMEGGEK